MPDEKDAVSEFLAGLDKPQADPFKSENDPFAPKEEAGKEEDEAVVDDKPIPFHKDPKVQRYVEKQIAKALESKPSEAQTFSKETEDEMTDVLTRIIGNDTPERVQAIKDFRRQLSTLEEKGAQRALQQLQEQERAQREEDVKAQTELDESFEEIEESYNVDLSSNAPSARKQRAEFVDYIRKIAPKNEDGEVSSFPDIPAAWEEFTERQRRTQPASRAKELASRSMSRSTDASAAPATGDRSWKGVEKLFSKLS